MMKPGEQEEGGGADAGQTQAAGPGGERLGAQAQESGHWQEEVEKPDQGNWHIMAKCK